MTEPRTFGFVQPSVNDLVVSEQGFQVWLVATARALGWRCYWVHDSRHSPAGWPDVVALRGGQLLAIELKSMRGKLTAEQAATIDALNLVTSVRAVAAWPNNRDQLEKMLKGADV